jgi:excisionase family DNA binding protein
MERETERETDRLSMSETARLLGISRWTVRRMIEEGELDAIHVRGMLRVERASVAAYIRDHRHTGRN